LRNHAASDGNETAMALNITGAGWLGAALVGTLAVGGSLALSEPLIRPAPPVAIPQASANAAIAPKPAADERFVIKRILPIEGPIRYGEWHWDESGAPDGPIVITVDLDARVLSVFRGGYEIGATAVLLGTQEKPTPTGVFPITQKQVRHISNLYDASMPYMQRLTDDGITIHATNVENGYASHGCIGTPLEFARKLYATTQPGDRVFITRGKKAGMGDSLIDS
jgi:lipoprotein-anchoring transpeptidase ErfK/SrfK